MLKKSWFRHEAISTKQANRLVKQYTQKGYHVEKTLNSDPELWDVAVKLIESGNNHPTPRCMINQVWNYPLYKNPPWFKKHHANQSYTETIQRSVAYAY